MTTAGEILFADTNVFLSATDRSRKHHAEARELLQSAGAVKAILAVSGQIIREYLVVATRPVEVNGLGLVVEDALMNIAVFTRKYFQFCEESEKVARRLRDFVQTHRLTGQARPRRQHRADHARGVDRSSDHRECGGLQLL